MAFKSMKIIWTEAKDIIDLSNNYQLVVDLTSRFQRERLAILWKRCGLSSTNKIALEMLCLVLQYSRKRSFEWLLQRWEIWFWFCTPNMMALFKQFSFGFLEVQVSIEIMSMLYCFWLRKYFYSYWLDICSAYKYISESLCQNVDLAFTSIQKLGWLAAYCSEWLQYFIV